MKKSLLVLPCFFFLFFLTTAASAQRTQRLDFAILRGTWEVKESRDLKIYKENKLHFNSLDASCYLKSLWTFDSDSTGFVTTVGSDKCPAVQTMKFTFQLFESPGYGGPTYKMGVHFENGYTGQLAAQTEDGQKKLMIGYYQTLAESSSEYNKVWIYFSLRKKS